MSESTLGFPRLHLRRTDSTNARARELAAVGAPHGTLVTAGAQDAGRGRQGRVWSAPPNRALLCSLVLREPPRLLPLVAGVAVADVVQALRPPDPYAMTMQLVAGGGGAAVQIKWPNDVHLKRGKVAGILVEGRPQESWAVLGIGLNVAVRPPDFPPELQSTAATLGLEPAAIGPALRTLLGALQRWLARSEQEVLSAFRIRDALLAKPIRWDRGEGVGAGIDPDGRLLVGLADGSQVALDAGEVHLLPAP